MSITALKPTALAAEVQHKTWCNHHVSPGQDDAGTCSMEWRLRDNAYYVMVDHDPSGPILALWGDGDPLTIEEGTEMAAAILDAVAVLKEEAVRARGALTMAQILTMTLSELQVYAKERGVAVSDVIRVAEKDSDPNA